MKTTIILLLGIYLGLQGVSHAPKLYRLPSVVVEAKYSPTPSPTPTDEQVIQEVVKVFAPEGRHVVVQAINCFYSESGLRWNAISPVNKNGTRDGGVAQLNDVHKMTMDERLDYKANIQKAYELYKRSGWNPWYGVGCK